MDREFIATYRSRGVMRLDSADGTSLLPESAKARGLIALILASSDGWRRRQWLQDKLWSDRGRDQAAGSLRQALSQIRKALGAHADLLEATRQSVSFDVGRIETIEDGDGEFLEDLDVRDPEFECWLAGERRRRVLPRAPAGGAEIGQLSIHHRKRWTIAVCAEGDGEGLAAWSARLLADDLGRTLRELFAADVIIGQPPDDNAWVVSVACFPAAPNRLGLRLSLEHPASLRQLWSGHETVPLRGGPPIEDPAIQRLANQLVEAVGDALLLEHCADSAAESADVLCRQAVRRMFTMRPEAVAEADAMFARAYAMEGRGLYLAWRAQVRTIQRVERHDGYDTSSLIAAGEDLAARAMELEPNNSMVLALLANAGVYLRHDVSGSLDMAMRSVLLNPGNAMAWWALSAARLYAGQTKDSYENAVRARNLAILSPHRYWWDNQQLYAALLLGRFAESIALLKRSVGQCSNFRPTYRYLTTLLASKGDEEGALRAAERLQALEPDFSIDRLVRDREYPASLIHRAPGLDLDRLAALA